MATLSAADQKLNADDQAKILKYKNDWAQAKASGNQEAMDAAHAAAEEIRRNAGYSGGAAGNAYLENTSGTANASSGSSAARTAGGASAADVQAYADAYKAQNYSQNKGWVNGYSTEMNMRSLANYIRQQMQANSQAWQSSDETTRDYLHQQNVELAEILKNATGGATSTYNAALGRWETDNANLGYGYNTGAYDDEDFYRDVYRMTDEQMNAYRSDTDRYSNYVDQDLIRNRIDESSGYTGVYSHFLNGAYDVLASEGTRRINPTVYKDVIGDGFNEKSILSAVYDENGNVVPQAPQLKYDSTTDYTRQFLSYVDENGVIQPGVNITRNPAGSDYGGGAHQLSGSSRSSGGSGVSTGQGGTVSLGGTSGSGGTDAQTGVLAALQAALAAGGEASGVSDDYTQALLTALQTLGGSGTGMMSVPSLSDYISTGGTSKSAPGYQGGPNQSFLNYYGSQSGGSGGSGAGNDLSGYLEQLYASQLISQILNLAAGYEQNLSTLAESEEKTNAQYDEQKRQTSGTAAREQANWNELANAYGLNSGTHGQARLAQSNQLQSDLNTLASAQAQAQADVERERALLGKEYQLAIMQAQADNNFELARALYEEAVRVDENLIAQQQYNTQLSLQQAQMAQDQMNTLLSYAASGNVYDSAYDGGSYSSYEDFSNGGSTGLYDYGLQPVEPEDDAEYTFTNQDGGSWIYIPGMGKYDKGALAGLEEAGRIEVITDEAKRTITVRKK